MIITLQVLGQTAFGFNLSIAQILVALGTCAVLEVGIAFFRHQVLMWPASALLTGNGVAFILRVPGTEHGDWWSMHGAWIFAGTSAIALLSKHVIRVHGRHIFNPSNFGLVVCFLALGKFRADPLDFWWGPMSPWMALALCVIVVGGFAILTRLRLLAIAVGFWLTFAAGMALLAVSGHSMTARWHVGPITGWDFWWLLVTSPEILIFLFFMITDPKTIPDGRTGRLGYAVGVGLLATLLIAPQTTEFATKVAVLTALALVCAARGGVELVGARRLTLRGRRPRRLVVGTAALVGALAYAGLVVAAGIPARPGPGLASAPADAQGLPAVTVVDSGGVAGIDDRSAQMIAHDIVVDLGAESDALRTRDLERATAGASRDVARVAVAADSGFRGATCRRGDVPAPARAAQPPTRDVSRPADRRCPHRGHDGRVDIWSRCGSSDSSAATIPSPSSGRWSSCSKADATSSLARRVAS